jgi:hypothetical protein
MFTEPLCPQCGSVLPMRELWRRANPNRFNLYTCGIICPICGIRLRVLQRYVLAFRLVSTAVLMAMVIFALSRVPQKDAQVPLALVICIPWVIFQVRFAPCFATVRIVSSDERLLYPLSPPPPIPETQEARESRESFEQLMEWSEMKLTEEPGPSWKCTSCGEENPSEFEVCWKCHRERGGCAETLRSHFD